MDIKIDFINWLKQTPEMLAKLMDVAVEFTKLQTVPVVMPGGGQGPEHFEFDVPPELTTIGISEADLDAIANAMGTAIVKEKAVEFLKGFLMGLTIRA